MRFWLSVLVCVLVVSTGHAATYYASPSGGSGTCTNPSAPCSVSVGLSKLTAAGDILYLRSGSYPGIELFGGTVANGTSNTVRTTIASFPGETATINGFGLNTYGGGVIEYMLLDRLVLTATMFFGGPHTRNNRFQNGEVRNAEGTGVQAYGIGSGHTNNQVVNSHIHHNGTVGRPTQDHGFYTGTRNFLIENCDIHDNSGSGIQIYDSTEGADTSGTIIRNNRVYNHRDTNNGWAMTLAHGHNIQVYNNVVYNNLAGIHVGYGNPNNHQLYNNTITGNTDAAIGIGTTDGSTATNTKVRNNILTGNGSVLWAFSAHTGTTFSNNLCNSLSAPVCDKAGAPAFTGESDNPYNIGASSDARNQGTDLSSVFTADILGAARGQGGAWDIGAYEYHEGGGTPISGNPIYVAKTGSSDSNDCTAAENPATPKLTLASACQCMTVPGKIMYIKAGTYVEKWDTLTCPITGGNGPSFSDATIISGYASDVVTIQLPSGTTNTPAMFLRNSTNDSYTIYRNLIIDGNNQVGSNGLAIYPSVHHIRFENVEVKNTLNGYEAVYMFWPNNIGFYDVRIHNAQTNGVGIDGTTSDIIFQRCKVSANNGKGLQLMGGATLVNLTVRECDVSSNALDGIDLESGNAILLANNRIYNNGAKGLIARSGVSNIQMYFQSITGNVGQGLECVSGVTGAEMKNVISYNNTAGNILNSCSAATATNFTTNPLFTNAATGDLTLQDGSGAIDTGTAIPGISNDFAGLTRPQGPTDIGSEERLAVPVGPGSDVTVLRRLLYQTGMLF